MVSTVGSSSRKEKEDSRVIHFQGLELEEDAEKLRARQDQKQRIKSIFEFPTR